MYTWIEYIAATVIAGVLALLLFNIQAQSQQTAIDSTQYRVAKTSVMDLIQMVEQDLKNLGSQHPSSSTSTAVHPLPGGATFGILGAPDTTSSPRTFQFYAQATRGAAPSLVRYEWGEDGTVTLSNGTTKPTYRVRRYVDGTLDGQSFDTVTRFRIWLLETDGNAITNIGETRQVFAEIRSVSPLGKGDTIEETRWSSVFRPLALIIN